MLEEYIEQLKPHVENLFRKDSIPQIKVLLSHIDITEEQNDDQDEKQIIN